MSNKKALVVYFSRSGNTRTVARSIADKIDSDIEEIVPEKNMTGFFNWLKCGFQAAKKKTPPIHELQCDPAAYDLVVIGTPVWAGQMSSPVRTFVAQKKSCIKNAAFFYTSGGTDNEKVFADMELLCGRKPVATLALTAQDMKANSYDEKVDAFCNAL
jgi:flavodoxin